jgi:hypothetical protein
MMDEQQIEAVRILRPIQELKAGRVSHVYVLTCWWCKKQSYIEGKGFVQEHRWWEKLGWARKPYANSTKGVLLCPKCAEGSEDDEEE